MESIHEIDEPEFEKEVLQPEQPVLVNFWGERSQACRIIRPVLDDIATECNGRAKIVKVNVDQNPDLGMWYGIQYIPTLVCFIHGEPKARIVGTHSKEAILAKLKLLAETTNSKT